MYDTSDQADDPSSASPNELHGTDVFYLPEEEAESEQSSLNQQGQPVMCGNDIDEESISLNFEDTEEVAKVDDICDLK